MKLSGPTVYIVQIRFVARSGRPGCDHWPLSGVGQSERQRRRSPCDSEIGVLDLGAESLPTHPRRKFAKPVSLISVPRKLRFSQY